MGYVCADELNYIGRLQSLGKIVLPTFMPVINLHLLNRNLHPPNPHQHPSIDPPKIAHPQQVQNPNPMRRPILPIAFINVFPWPGILGFKL